jgi:WD40 repeat protein/energy-coupling factor transporter ATP-binding protein EcfA2
MFEGNPFPGLRPFEFDENYLFFGREEQVSQLLQRLGNTRFLAVVGASGSGKSSLVRAGLLPELHGGTMTSTSIAWEISIMRPGGDPLTKLAQALVESNLFGDVNEENVLQTRATLSRSGLGLIEAYRQSDIEEGTNLLLLVDQFEEIFRFRQSGDKTGQEASHFIQLLLETARQTEFPIFIILTMRSDFLGDCAEFKGLAEAVNEGEYLIPRLNRKQRARAIEGPVKVGGAEISPRLKQQLLNDIGDDPDQLPILQHALMRMWDYWLNNANREQALDLDHYNGIGRMTEALSRHGDEVYEELPDDDHRLLCMKLFKAITEKQGDGRGVRRPLPFSEIDEITGHQREKILTVIDAYRPIGRTFIMPGQNVKIHDKIIIDISHESLMRVWQRLKNWVNDEADSARIYIRLCETAQLHNRGEAGFYRDPDLKIALAWRDNNKPNANWGTRINDSFELAMLFLDDSSEDFEAEQKAKEEARKRELEQAKALANAERERAEIQRKSAKRNKVFAVFLFALALLAGVMAYQATVAKKEAKNALSEAKMVEAELFVDNNEPHNAIALLTSAHKDNREYKALLRRNLSIADTQPLPQYKETLIEDPDSLILNNGIGVRFSSDKTRVATLHKKKGNSGLRVYDLNDKSLLFESEKYSVCETAEFSADGKYIVLTAEKLTDERCLIVLETATGSIIREIVVENKLIHADVSNDMQLIAAGSNKGEILVWEAPDYEKQLLKKTDADISEVRINPVTKKLAAISYKDNSNYDFIFFDLTGGEPLESTIYSSPKDQERWWAECHFSRSGNHLVLNGGSDQVGSLVVFDGMNGEELWIDEASHRKVVFDCDFSPDETLLATASLDMTCMIWNIETGDQFVQPLHHSAGLWNCRFSLDQTKLIASDYSSNVVIWDVNKGTLLQHTFGQEAPILNIAATENPDEIIVALLNGKIVLWDIKRRNRLPVLFTHNGEIKNSLLLPGDRLVTSGQDAKVKVWDLHTLGEYKELPVEDNVWWMDYSESSKRLYGIMCRSWMNATGVMSWNLPDLTIDKVFKLPPDSSRVGIHPDGNLIAYSNNNVFSVDLYDMESDKLIKKFHHHGDFVAELKFSPDGKKLITACFDELARIYDLSNPSAEPITIEYGFSWGGRIIYSNDGQFFLLRTTIGSDSTAAKLYRVEDGAIQATFVHESAVREAFFSPDDSRLYTCSRSGEVKVWDLDNGGKLVLAVKQRHPVAGVFLSPNHDNKLITLDVKTDARIWDIELGKVVDGPFRGAPDCDYWFMKLHASDTLSGFVGYYGPTALAFWPDPVSLNVKDVSSNITGFTQGYIGGGMDKNSSFKIMDRENQDSQAMMAGYNPNDPTLKRWKSWFLSETKKSVHSPTIGLSKTEYIEFLKKQKTKESLETALTIDSSDSIVLKLYGEELLQRSRETGIKAQIKASLEKRGNWYLNRASALE